MTQLRQIAAAIVAVSVLGVLLQGADAAAPREPAGAAAVASAVKKPPKAKRPPKGSFSLIDAARAKGKLSQKKALLYKLFAVFGDPRLPKAYRGNAKEPLPGSLFMRDLASRYRRLDRTTRAAVAPFFLPPIYRGSFADRHGRAPRSIAALGPDLLSAHADEPEFFDCASEQLRGKFWANVPTANGRVRVWWQNGKPLSARWGTFASAIAREIDSTIWPKLTSLMGRTPLPDGDTPCFNGEDDRYDIYLLDQPIDGGALGLTIAYPPRCTATPAFTILDATPPAYIPRALSRWVVAHELFHAIQFAFTYAKPCADYDVIDESTATWAADYVYPTDDRFLPPNDHEFLCTLDGPLYGRVFPADCLYATPYQSWTFFLSLTKRLGNALIPAIYQKTRRLGPLEAVDKAIPRGFKKQLPEFARDAWNHEPVLDTFRRWDRIDAFPGRAALKADPGYRFEIELPAGKSRTAYDFSWPLGPLSWAYNDWYFDDPDVHLVRVKPRNPGDPGIHIRALLKVRAQDWREEDWTSRKEVKLCRDEPSEDVTRIVVVYSRSTLPPAGEVNLPPRIEAENACARSYVGTVKGSYEGSGLAGKGNETWTAVNLRFDPQPGRPQVLELTSGVVNWSAESSDTLSGCKATGSASLSPLGAGAAALLDVVEEGYYLKGSYARRAPVRLVCPAYEGTGEVDVWAEWLSSGATARRLAPDGSVRGSFDQDFGAGITAHWEWDLRPARAK